MKKFLFTLASLVAFGFAANAQPVIALNTTEVTMGQENNTLECYFVLQDFGGAAQIKGMDYKLEMHNVAGEIITAPVHLEFLEKYGSAEEWKWFGDVSDPAQQGNNITATNGLPGGYAANVTLADDFGPLMPIMDGVETGSEVVYTGKYNFINVNTGRGYLWNGRFGTGKNIIGFTIKVEEGWNEPYAELVVTQANVSANTGEFAMELQTLKINNADYEEPGQDKLDCDSPSIQRINNNDGTYTIQIMAGYTEDFEQQTDGKLNYDVDVEPEVATFNAELNAWELDYAAGTEDVTVHVVAWTDASETFNASAEAVEDIVIPALPQVATPTMSYTYDNEEGTITVTATTTTEGATCYVVGPDNVAHVAPYTFNYDIYEGYNENWTAYATAPNMTQSANCEAYNVVVEEVEKVYQTNDPEITAVPDNAREVVVITVTGEGNIVVTVTGVNGQIASAEGTEPVVVEVPFLPVGSEPEFVSVKAVATADLPAGYDRVLPATVTEPVEIPAKQEVVLEDLTGELVFSAVDQTNGTFTVTYEGPEEDVVVTIVGYQERGANGQLPEQGKYYNVTAKASKAGYNDLTDNDELIWLYKPVIDVNVETVQQWIGPEDNAVLTTGQIVTLEGIENDNPDGVIMYSIDGGTPKVWTGDAVPVTGNGDHVIEAWVVANGDVESEHAVKPIHIDNDFTAVNEIANGKAVAGVRYFNLAGQEMTEANGVTIVVTTYTDGTTSAVKVMK